MHSTAKAVARLSGFRVGAHFVPRPRARKGKGAVAIVTLIATLSGLVVTAGAVTTRNPSGPVVRDDTMTIDVNPGGLAYSQSSSSANYTATAPFLTPCKGDNPSGTNNSPRSRVVVTGPSGVVLDQLSPARNVTIAGALGGYPILDPQPAPANGNYRGGVPASGSTPSKGWSTTLNLAGKPAGTYTITTTTQNMVRTGALGACTIGTPNRNSSGALTNTSTPGLVTETETFEYRPWAYVFTDIFGGGKVSMNINPAEFQQVVSGVTGAIHDSAAYTQFFAVPSGDFVPLPSDPNECAGNPSSCLPPNASLCDPGAGCQPRIAIVHFHGHPTEALNGFFDLETGAFIARTEIQPNQRLMVSLGRDGDAVLRDLLAQLSQGAAQLGIDLPTLLATTVRVRLGATEIRLSLLNGLQIAATPNGAPSGVQIVSDFTVQAGLILDIYANLDLTKPCVATAGDSDPNTPAPDRYAPLRDVGYTVERSDFLPDVPRVGPLGALVGGPIYHITGDFVGSGTPLVNTAMAVIGADTAADEPNGLPVWIEPFISSPTHVTAPRTMDFLGTATWSASETPVSTIGCTTIDFMLGAGVALYNNPLPIGFGTLPIWDPTSPEIAALIDTIDAAVQQLVGDVAANPTVAELLEQVTALLPPLPV
jgi:hypothetical protein